MRYLLRSLTALSALAVAGSIGAHAAGITYTGTTTITDTTTHTVVGSNSFSFVDPPATYADSFTVNGNISDEDVITLGLNFTAPGSGSGSFTGDADTSYSWVWTGRYWSYEGTTGIDWDTTNPILISLSNGSKVQATAHDFDLQSYGCANHASLCGSSTVDLKVTVNDPAIAPTPEPSSLALLGTGILGLAGVVRRKLAI